MCMAMPAETKQAMKNEEGRVYVVDQDMQKPESMTWRKACHTREKTDRNTKIQWSGDGRKEKPETRRKAGKSGRNDSRD